MSSSSVLAAPASAPADASTAGWDPGRWTLANMADALEQGDTSPQELVEIALARLASHDAAVGAFAHVRTEGALAEARRATERRARGFARSRYDGIPVAVKDLGDHVEGVPVTLGCRSVLPRPARASSVRVRRLEAAGFIVVGTTNVPELGHRATTDNDLRGPTSSPFAPGRLNAGGSSGGSAAAVAAGMVPAALGSDGAGSIRVPAALCGVVGLKPSFGLVPAPTRPNAFRNGALFVSAGPLTRTIADARLLLDVLAGPDRDDPFCAPAWAADVPRHRRRVGMLPDLGGFPVEPAVVDAVELAGESLAAAGYEVDTYDLRLPASPGQLCELVRRSVGWTLADAIEGLEAQALLRRDELQAFSPSLLQLVDEARGTSTDGWRADGRLRTRLLDAVEDALAHVDLLIGPVTAVTEVPNALPGRTLGPDRVAGTSVDPVFGWSTTWPFNLTGHPAITVPCLTSPEGAPLAVQLVGRRGADRELLVAAEALERLLPWCHRYRELLPEE